jgi:hypothetical protein
MQYLVMCCMEEKRWDALPQSERDRVMKDYTELVQSAARSGQYLAGAKLTPTSAATTVREKNGRPVITDGPYAETKEQLGGYHVIEAKDLDEAMAFAQRIPTLRVGGAVEVRPIEYPAPV